MADELTPQRTLLVAFVLVTTLLCCAWPRVARGESRPSYGETLESTLLEEPLNVDPITAQSHTDMTIVALFFDTLYRRDRGTIVPHLAAALPVYASERRATIVLRPGVKFHDGSPLRAQDVVKSLERLRASPLGFLLESVKSIDVVARGEGVDAETISVGLKRPTPELAAIFSDLHTSITARGVEPSWRRLVGTGPWRLGQRSTKKGQLVLKAFDDHSAGRGYVDELILRWHASPDAEARSYEAGTTHISSRGSIAFAGHRPKFQTESLEADIGALAFLGFGRASPILGETEFRQALSASIGRLGMQQIGSGEAVEPTITVLPPKRRPRPFALKANRRLASDLFSKLANRYPEVEAKSLTIQIIANASRPDDAVVAARVAAGLFEHGVAARIVTLSPDVFARRVRSGQCDLYVGQLAVSGSQPIAQLQKAFVVGGQQNLASKLRGKSKQELERHLSEELPIIPLYHRSLRLHRRSDVLGLGFTGAGTIDYPRVYFFGQPVKN